MVANKEFIDRLLDALEVAVLEELPTLRRELRDEIWSAISCEPVSKEVHTEDTLMEIADEYAALYGKSKEKSDYARSVLVAVVRDFVAREEDHTALQDKYLALVDKYSAVADKYVEAIADAQRYRSLQGKIDAPSGQG